MILRDKRNFISLLVLIPVAVFFLSCCCLQAEAKLVSSEKSKCGACPKTQSSKQDKSAHDDCPHAKVKAVNDNQGTELSVAKYFFLPAVYTQVVLPESRNSLPLQLTAPPIYASLDFHNPILRV